MRRNAGRVGLGKADDKVGVVGGTGRREMIQEPKFQELGRPIGSGPTGSMGKATTQRIKGRGMRWGRGNAEGIMALEQSGAWQDYWEAQLRLAA
jgi:hypothetical protein